MRKKLLLLSGAVFFVTVSFVVWRLLRLKASEPPPERDPFLRSIQLMEKPEEQTFSPQEFEELVRFASHPNELIRTHALVALARCQSGSQRSRALEIMRKALQDPSDTVCIFALRGLAALGGSEDIPRVEPFLNHPNPLVQSRARKTLEMLKRKSQSSKLQLQMNRRAAGGI